MMMIDEGHNSNNTNIWLVQIHYHDGGGPEYRPSREALPIDDGIDELEIKG